MGQPDPAPHEREWAEQLAEKVAADEVRVASDQEEIRCRLGGRPRPAGQSGEGSSAQVRVPVTDRTRAELERIARQQGRRLSDVSRDALDEYVARHAG